MVGCKRGCLHRSFVQQYHVERAAAEGERDGITGGYATENAEYGQIINFKQYLIQNAGPQEEL